MLGEELVEANSDTVRVCLLSLGGLRTSTPLPPQVSPSDAISVFVSQR